MEMESCRSEIKWPDFVRSAMPRQEPAKAVVCPLVVKEGEPCFAVRIDQRWLCGSEGSLTFFDSLAAASRFLILIQVREIAYEQPRAVSRERPSRFQCFTLSGRGLTACAQCRIGEATCNQEARELARQDERW